MSLNEQSKTSRDFSSYLGRNYGSNANNFDSFPKSKMFSIISNANLQTSNNKSPENIQEHSFDQRKNSFIDNFKFISGKPHANYLKPQFQNQKKSVNIKPEYSKNQAKAFYVNGVNYYKDQLPCDKKAEVLKDCYSVKGDYFYLKKGQIVQIRYVIGQYVQAKFQKFFGYFPAMFFKLL